MTAQLFAPIALILLVWIATGVRSSRPDWLERRTGLFDQPGGNAAPDRSI